MCVFWGVEDFLHGVPRDCHGYANNTLEYSTNSSGAFSVGGHAHAHVLGRPAVKIAAIGFNNSIVIHLF